MRRRVAVAILAALAPTAGAQGLDGRSRAEADFDNWMTACRERFAEVDARVDAAGVRDAGFHRIPGFPYLRSDRLIAAFRDSVDSFESLGDWTAQLRENDSLGRDVELSNLGLPRQERAQLLSDLRLCSVWLANVELARPDTFRRLVDAVVIPGDWSGPDAAAVPPASPPRDGSPSAVPQHHWRAQTTMDPADAPQDFSGVQRDTLGRIGLFTSAWRALVEKHAPELIVGTGGNHDRPGALAFDGASPRVQVERPAVYYLAGFARVNGRTLVQLSYLVWFSAHLAQSRNDPEAGQLDGLIWRVTLDDAGRPLIYESASASGAHHRWYPAQPVRVRAGLRDRVDVAPGLAPTQAAVRIASGTHAVSGVASQHGAGSETSSYVLLPYEDLLTLPTARGGTRSLFGPDGVVPGSERAHGAALWPRGFPKPGAMRQWGHHAVSFAPARYLDDPALFEATFDLPPARRLTASIERRLLAFLPLHRAEEDQQ